MNFRVELANLPGNTPEVRMHFFPLWACHQHKIPRPALVTA
jgi:hypothetical protein